MKKLIKTDVNKENIVSYGNMFLIGNGHLGYRGTLEEYDSSCFVGLNIVGFYDRYKNKWRESLNAPNPFFIQVSSETEECNVLKTIPLNHSQELLIDQAIFTRQTEFDSVKIYSERFISSTEDNLLCTKYTITSKKEQNINIKLGLDLNIWEINGPHFKKMSCKKNRRNTIFVGKTNENKYLKMDVRYLYDDFDEENFSSNMRNISAHFKENETRVITIFAKIVENCSDFNKINSFSKSDYKYLKESHIVNFKKKFKNARVKIEGDPDAQYELDYSIYHLLILENENYQHSIPARGLSGQTYKGAIFWDTEIFMIPFYLLTNPKMAKSLLMYRINTLNGALEKAKMFGFCGAFYPWESQEGKEMCSKYNVTDAITGKPVRTYFNEKQIHISADIVYAIENYINYTGDKSILKEGALDVMIEVFNFFKSYSVLKNNKYHINDVIGPDEYHERVNNNAFTNYMVEFCCRTLIKYLDKDTSLYNEVLNFVDNLYLPKIQKNNLIEQFDGYFDLEKTTVDEVRSRLKHPNEYRGTKNGVASSTQVIKQADVVTLLILLSNQFNKKVKKANYHYYYPITEHGSSLSASMYSLLGCEIGEKEIAYNMFRKSSSIDLGTNQKMFAGGIYIGGTHPASNGGAYMSVVYGFCGLKIKNDQLIFTPNLPKSIKKIKFKVNFREKQYNIVVSKNKAKMEEIINEN